jgi:hypothetical protein
MTSRPRNLCTPELQRIRGKTVLGVVLDHRIEVFEQFRSAQSTTGLNNHIIEGTLFPANYAHDETIL